MKPKLRLYVWTEFCPDYTSGLAVAIAESEEKARKLVTEYWGLTPHDWGTLEIHALTKRYGVCVSGGG